ncbi:MAG: Holliday junction resolvase RecU [Bulleidia sp.]
MVNYPDGRKKSWAPSASSAADRGMNLEHDINVTNTHYRNVDRAVIHKKPTPVQIVRVDYPKRSAARITEAYFKIPSTTDYNGIYRGRYLDFEAKECAQVTSFPLKSLHTHQLSHLEAVLRHGAIAFLIIRFTKKDHCFLVPAENMIRFCHTSQRSSIPYDWFFENGYVIPSSYLKPVDYLEVIDQLYFSKEENE